MPRARKVEIGHNSAPLTEDEASDLQHYYTRDIRTKEAKVVEAKAAYDAARTEVNKTFALVKGELGYSRKEFEEILELDAMTEEEFVAHEEARGRRLSRQGMPVVIGVQHELPLGDTADDQARAFVEGRRAGIRADDPKPPETVSPILHGKWMEGWHEGQAENISKLGRAEAFIARRAAEKASVDDEPEDDEEEEEFDEAKAARDLKRSGFLDRAEAEAESELADA